MRNQNESYGYDHYERHGYGQPQQPGYPPRRQEPGVLEILIEKLGSWLLAVIFAPLWVLFTDNSAAVRKRASEESPTDKPAKTIGLFLFPILLATVGLFTDLSSLIVAATAPIVWLSLAKRLPARHLIDFSTAKIITSARKLSKPMLIGTGAAIAATALLAVLDRGSLAGIPAVLAGYPAAMALGRQRIKEFETLHANDAADRRLIMIALGGLSDSQAESLSIYRTGSQSEGTLQIHSGQLPPAMISVTADSVEAVISVQTPEWEVVSISADAGLVLGAVSDATSQRREQLRQTGGLVAGVSEAEPPAAGPSAGFTATTDGFAPGDVF